LKTILKTLALAVPTGLIVVVALMMSGMYREIGDINIKLEQINNTQTNIINWVAQRQEPFNNDIISWANNVSSTIQELRR